MGPKVMTPSFLSGSANGSLSLEAEGEFELLATGGIFFRTGSCK